MKNKTILLVEDNEQDEILTLRALKKCSLLNEVIVARDGQEALDFLFSEGQYAGAGSQDLPQVVLLDLKLPKIDGHEVLKRIRNNERTSTLPVVILTTSQEDTDVASGYKNGANSYVRKPVESEMFHLAIKELGLYWLLLNIPAKGS